MAKAIVLLSGGLDSATALAIAARQGFEIFALSFRYGQRHAIELECANAVANAARVARHVVMDIDMRLIGGSALTSNVAVPKRRSTEEMSENIPATYVPARNTVFLSYALAWAEVLDSRDIFIGVNVLDYSGYPDCRPEYIECFEQLANLATKAGVQGQHRIRVHAPLVYMSKAEIIQEGIRLGVDYGATSSCYDPGIDGRPCGECDSCLLRAGGFAEAGVLDPRLEHFP